MGFFSWKCCVCNESIPAHPYACKKAHLSDVVLVLPTDQTISGIYDGYGNIGDQDIYDVLAQILWGESADRSMVFDDVKYLQDPVTKERFTINQFDWSQRLKQFNNKSLNSLAKSGWIISSKHDIVNRLIKIVRKDHYTGQKYDELKVSERCPDQGYFY